MVIPIQASCSLYQVAQCPYLYMLSLPKSLSVLTSTCSLCPSHSVSLPLHALSTQVNECPYLYMLSLPSHSVSLPLHALSAQSLSVLTSACSLYPVTQCPYLYMLSLYPSHSVSLPLHALSLPQSLSVLTSTCSFQRFLDQAL